MVLLFFSLFSCPNLSGSLERPPLRPYIRRYHNFLKKRGVTPFFFSSASAKRRAGFLYQSKAYPQSVQAPPPFRAQGSPRTARTGAPRQALRKNADGTYRDIAHPITADFRSELEETVLAAFRKALEEQKEIGSEEVPAEV